MGLEVVGAAAQVAEVTVGGGQHRDERLRLARKRGTLPGNALEQPAALQLQFTEFFAAVHVRAPP